MGDMPSTLISSPPYSFSCPQLVAGASTNMQWESVSVGSRAYLPFNQATIYNTSNYDVIVYVNQMADRPVFIPANSIITLRPEDVGGVFGFSIENISAYTITAGQVRIVCIRQSITPSSAMGRIANRLFGQ